MNIDNNFNFLKTAGSKHIIRILVAAKVLIIIFAVALHRDIFRFGEKNLSAQDASKAEDTQTTTGKSLKKATDSQESKEDRKSFLSDLFELPTLDPATVKKDEIGKYLELAERKQSQVEQRLQLLERREMQLKSLENSIQNKLLKLEEERRFFTQTIQKEKDLTGDRLTKLIELYAKMEPKKAAPVFAGLDKDLVVALFQNLPQKQITSILENMDPQKSVELSEYFGRVRSGREYDLLKEMNKSLQDEFEKCRGMPENTANTH